MRALAVLLVVTAATLAHASDATRVDGVRVYGRLDDVTTADIRQAIADFRSTSVDKHPPVAIQVLSSREMRAYLPGRDVGWMAIHSIPRGDAGHYNELAWTTWGRAIQDAPEAVRFVRDATEVCVFPVVLSERHDKKLGMLVSPPHRDAKRMRVLAPQARRELVHIVGNERSWFHGVDDTFSVGDLSTNVGFVFRRGGDELTLYFTLGWRAECTLPTGEHLAGSLEEKPSNKLEEWKKRYAQPELAAK